MVPAVREETLNLSPSKMSTMDISEDISEAQQTRSSTLTCRWTLFRLEMLFKSGILPLAYTVLCHFFIRARAKDEESVQTEFFQV